MWYQRLRPCLWRLCLFYWYYIETVLVKIKRKPPPSYLHDLMVHERINGKGIVVGDFALFYWFINRVAYACAYAYSALVVHILYARSHLIFWPYQDTPEDWTRSELSVPPALSQHFCWWFANKIWSGGPAVFTFESMRIIPVTLQLMQLFPLLFSSYSLCLILCRNHWCFSVAIRSMTSTSRSHVRASTRPTQDMIYCTDVFTNHVN